MLIEDHQGKHTHLQNMVNCIRPCATVASKADIICVFVGCTVQLLSIYQYIVQLYTIQTMYQFIVQLLSLHPGLLFLGTQLDCSLRPSYSESGSRNQKQQTVLELTGSAESEAPSQTQRVRIRFFDRFCRILYCLSLTVKNLPAMAGDPGSIPGSGRSPGEGNGNTLQ